MKNINWIECNLPWSNPKSAFADYFDSIEDSFPREEVDILTKKEFGVTLFELEQEAAKIPLAAIVRLHRLEEEYDMSKSLEELMKLTKDQEVIKYLKIRILSEKIEDWESNLDICKEYYDKLDSILDKKNEEPADPVSFSSIAKPGMLIELESGKQMLIGHINEVGGICEDCMGINKSDVIKRYAVILKFEES